MAEANWSEVFGDTPGPDFGAEKPQQKTTDWGQVFGDKPGPTDTSETATAKDEYEKLVQSKEAEANKIMKGLGVQGAIEAGIQSTPIVGPIVQGIGATVGAALPESLGFATGDTYSKRKEDLYAQFEAMQRAAEKQHPYVKTGTEIASSLALPAGGISAVGEAATGSKLLGLGLEGATYGGASALAEKAGSKPESEQQGVGSSALLGGELGLGLGAAGATVGKAVEKFAPEWMSAVGNKDDYQVSQLAKAMNKDVKAGTASMPVDDFFNSMQNGSQLNITDFGPNTQKYVEKIFKNQPDLADQFRNKLLDRANDSATDFSSFARNLANSDLNADRILTEAKAEASKAKDEAYTAAYQPGNGAGTWNPEWTRSINLPEVKTAIQDAEDALVKDAAYKDANPNGRFPIIGQVKSPFTTIEAPNGAFKYVVSSPQAVDMKYIDFLQRKLNDQIDLIPSRSEGGVKNSLVNIRQKILSDVTTPGSPYYNADFAEAFNSTPLFRGESDAFTYGTNILARARDSVASSKIMNETAMMTPAEKNFAVQGVMSKMLADSTITDAVGNSFLNTKKLQQYFAPGNTNQAMMNAFGAQKYADLKRYVDMQSIMSETFNKARQYGKVQSTVPRDLSTIVGFLLFDKYALAKVLADIGNKFMTDRYAKSMVQRLMSDDPQSIRSAYDDIINNKPVRGAVTNMLSRFVPVAGGQAGIQPMGRQTQTNPVEDYVNSQLQAAGIKRAFGGRVAYKGGGRIHKDDGGGTDGGPGSAPGGDESMSGSEGMGAGSAGNLGGTDSQTVRNDSNLGGSDAGFSARAGDTPGFNTGMQRGVGPGVGEPSNQYGGGGGYGEAPVPQDMTVHGGPVFGGPNDQMSNLLSQTPGPALMQKALDNAGTFGGWFAGLNSPQPGNPYSDISMAGSQQMINNINAGNPSDFGTLAGIEGRYGSTQPAHPSTPTPGSAYGPDSSVNPASPTSSDNAYNYTPRGVAPVGGYSGIPEYQGVGVGSPIDAYNRQTSPTANTVRSDFNNAFANAAAAGLHTFDWTNPVTGQRGTYAVKTRATGGVVKRATGGRIPEVDKLYKAAKKLVDNSTKPMLNVDDDYIAKALRVAKGLV